MLEKQIMIVEMVRTSVGLSSFLIMLLLMFQINCFSSTFAWPATRARYLRGFQDSKRHMVFFDPTMISTGR